MKPHEQCKAAGLKNLAELVQITGISRHTLMHWAKHKTGLFKTLIAGAKVLRDAKKNTSYK